MWKFWKQLSCGLQTDWQSYQGGKDRLTSSFSSSCTKKMFIYGHHFTFLAKRGVWE